jgi:hypothetical protein
VYCCSFILAVLKSATFLYCRYDSFATNTRVVRDRACSSQHSSIKVSIMHRVGECNTGFMLKTPPSHDKESACLFIESEMLSQQERYASFMNDIACDLQIQRNAFLIKETSSSGPVVGAESLCMSN